MVAIASPAIDALVARVQKELAGSHPQIAGMFEGCFRNSLDTSITREPDGSTFVATGDIPAMWLRDSAAQVRPYMPLAAADEEIRALLRGLIRRTAQCVNRDPYANAFNDGPNGNGHQSDQTDMTPWTWERKWELDSLCYPVMLLSDWWEATRDASAFDSEVHRMLRSIVDTMRTEQRHGERSAYRFWRTEHVYPHDNLPDDGRGAPVGDTGMVWVGFRPSDDACAYPFHVPSNMFAAAILPDLAAFARDQFDDMRLGGDADSLAEKIRAGIEEHAVVEHPRFGRIYAYETDGLGNHLLMDDANVPSLLSIPYLGYRAADDPVYLATRAFVLSRENPYFFAGSAAAGVGSPHTPDRHAWPIGISMQALTATDPAEIEQLLSSLATTTAGTGLMHESFDVDDPSRFTRPWFGWANSLFAEAVLRWIG
ncbi:MAG TPA: glycoside hydrolase family 125 protein [Candidatus Limnocylindrales bacterium]|nr:glycoside hydrolase family 125 protein [Candidatus Limnocylindrales bacterium]